MRTDSLNRALYEFEFSDQVADCLRIAGINTVRDLVQVPGRELLKMKGFNVDSLLEVQRVLSRIGCSLELDGWLKAKLVKPRVIKFPDRGPKPRPGPELVHAIFQCFECHRLMPVPCYTSPDSCAYLSRLNEVLDPGKESDTWICPKCKGEGRVQNLEAPITMAVFNKAFHIGQRKEVECSSNP